MKLTQLPPTRIIVGIIIQMSVSLVRSRVYTNGFNHLRTHQKSRRMLHLRESVAGKPWNVPSRYSWVWVDTITPKTCCFVTVKIAKWYRSINIGINILSPYEHPILLGEPWMGSVVLSAFAISIVC